MERVDEGAKAMVMNPELQKRLAKYLVHHCFRNQSLKIRTLVLCSTRTAETIRMWRSTRQLTKFPGSGSHDLTMRK